MAARIKAPARRPILRFRFPLHRRNVLRPHRSRRHHPLDCGILSGTTRSIIAVAAASTMSVPVEATSHSSTSAAWPSRQLPCPESAPRSARAAPEASGPAPSMRRSVTKILVRAHRVRMRSVASVSGINRGARVRPRHDRREAPTGVPHTADRGSGGRAAAPCERVGRSPTASTSPAPAGDPAEVAHPRVQALYETWGFRGVGDRQPFSDSPLHTVVLAELPLA